MNVAILSASRKVWLVRAFQTALAANGGGRVWALDTDRYATALQEADAALVSPRSDDSAFPTWLQQWCQRERISLVVPTRDAELPVIAAMAEGMRANGVHLAVSPPEAVRVCLDKRRFAEACRHLGLSTPVEIPDPACAKFPVFVKPRVGQAGRGTMRIDSSEQLVQRGYDPEHDILQEFVRDPEYTIDVYVDSAGCLISAVPRERVRVVAGESVVGRTVADDLLAGAAGRLALGLGVRAHVTVQAFRGTDCIRFVEVNPRYGGGAALGFAAGCPTPEWLVREALGQRLEPHVGRHQAGVWMFRHTEDLFLRDADLRRAEEADLVSINGYTKDSFKQ